ncbi:MAG: CDP-diacylglycerol--glycerol-3-phosphate 3-phosphatidyltransferase [Candidatus Dormibacteria bacterium]
MRRHLTLPNQLTLLRLLLVPVVVYCALAGFNYHYQAAAAVFAAAAITDTVDGRIARSRNLVSELGKFLDPLADKLLVISALLVLVNLSLVAVWVVIVIVAREFLITGLRTLAASQGVVVGSTPWGKSKTLTQNMMIGLIMLSQPYAWVKPVALTVLGLAVAATVLSGLDYLWRYRSFVV